MAGQRGDDRARGLMTEYKGDGTITERGEDAREKNDDRAEDDGRAGGRWKSKWTIAKQGDDGRAGGR